MKRLGNKWLMSAFVIVLTVAVAFLWTMRRYQRTSPDRMEDRYAHRITPYTSSSDRDCDGIDDQTDILEGAIRYIASRPKYKSKYYVDGYPDDG